MVVSLLTIVYVMAVVFVLTARSESSGDFLYPDSVRKGMIGWGVVVLLMLNMARLLF